MKPSEQKRALDVAIKSARAAGALMKKHFHEPKRINAATQHDLKLQLDVECQQLIEKKLAGAFPEASVIGEEGENGDKSSDYRWVIDPIDGTVNFAYGIPHSCVSIALQEKLNGKPAPKKHCVTTDGYSTVLGVVYDPFVDELWTGTRGGKAFLNGRAITASRRTNLEESIVSMGFSKRLETMNVMMPVLNRLIHRVRKVRIMGAAALALTYVASGRNDAYLEVGVRLWDIAAGGLILECAGGEFYHTPIANEYHAYKLIVNNGVLRKQLTTFL